MNYCTKNEIPKISYDNFMISRNTMKRIYTASTVF